MHIKGGGVISIRPMANTDKSAAAVTPSRAAYFNSYEDFKEMILKLKAAVLQGGLLAKIEALM